MDDPQVNPAEVLDLFETRPAREDTRHGGFAAALTFDGVTIGSVGVDEAGTPTVRLNLGWTKAAGVRVLVQGDPDVDRKRGGVVLDR